MEDLRITGLTLNNVGVFEHLELIFKKNQQTALPAVPFRRAGCV